MKIFFFFTSGITSGITSLWESGDCALFFHGFLSLTWYNFLTCMHKRLFIWALQISVQLSLLGYHPMQTPASWAFPDRQLPFPQLKDIAKFPPGFPVLLWELKTKERVKSGNYSAPLDCFSSCQITVLYCLMSYVCIQLYSVVITYFRREGRSVLFHTFWNLAISHTLSVPANIIEEPWRVFFSLKICRTLRIIPV